LRRIINILVFMINIHIFIQKCIMF
jgi:hypothetical protein